LLGAPCRLDGLLEFCDQIFEIVRLSGERERPLTLRLDRALDLRLAPLALLDENAHALLLSTQRGDLGCLPVALDREFLADADEIGELRHQALRFGAHLRQHSPEEHRGANRIEGILGPGKHGGRRAVADALQRRQHLGDQRSPAGQRPALVRFAAFQFMQAGFYRRHPLLGGADAGGTFDQRRGQLAPFLGECLVFGRELLLFFARMLLLAAQRIELLLARLERVGGGLFGGGVGFIGLCRLDGRRPRPEMVGLLKRSRGR
jgi:hypothetical protein